jgi:hypothetical protein
MDKLESKLVQLGYDYEEIGPLIFLVKDFLSDDSIIQINKAIESATQKDWEKHYMEGVIDLAYRKYSRYDIENLVEEGLVEITNDWHDKNLGLKYDISGPISDKILEIFSFDKGLGFDGVGTIQRQYSGSELREHVDNHADPLIEYAVIMYVNDDYNDGELFFSRLGISIKPPKKSLLIFPSGEDYLHGVKPPSEGPFRYVLPSFVRRKNEQ